MDEAVGLLGVAAVSMLELWGAIPLGLAMRIDPVLVCVVSAAGSTVGAVVIVLFGERLRSWLLAHCGRKGRGESGGWSGLLYRIWERYGVIGLGLLAPLVTGVPLGAALGVALGAPAPRLLIWLGLGSAVWSAGLTIAFYKGFELLL